MSLYKEDIGLPSANYRKKYDVPLDSMVSNCDKNFKPVFANTPTVLQNRVTNRSQLPSPIRRLIPPFTKAELDIVTRDYASKDSEDSDDSDRDDILLQEHSRQIIRSKQTHLSRTHNDRLFRNKKLATDAEKSHGQGRHGNQTSLVPLVLNKIKRPAVPFEPEKCNEIIPCSSNKKRLRFVKESSEDSDSSSSEDEIPNSNQLLPMNYFCGKKMTNPVMPVLAMQPVHYPMCNQMMFPQAMPFMPGFNMAYNFQTAGGHAQKEAKELKKALKIVKASKAKKHSKGKKSYLH